MSADREDLEAKVMFLERRMDGLNDAMVEQGRLIMALEQRLERFEQKEAAKAAPEMGPHDSSPPHY